MRLPEDVSLKIFQKFWEKEKETEEELDRKEISIQLCKKNDKIFLGEEVEGTTFEVRPVDLKCEDGEFIGDVHTHPLVDPSSSEFSDEDKKWFWDAMRFVLSEKPNKEKVPFTFCIVYRKKPISLYTILEKKREDPFAPLRGLEIKCLEGDISAIDLKLAEIVEIIQSIPQEPKKEAFLERLKSKGLLKEYTIPFSSIRKIKEIV